MSVCATVAVSALVFVCAFEGEFGCVLASASAVVAVRKDEGVGEREGSEREASEGAEKFAFPARAEGRVDGSLLETERDRARGSIENSPGDGEGDVERAGERDESAGESVEDTPDPSCGFTGIAAELLRERGRVGFRLCVSVCVRCLK